MVKISLKSSVLLIIIFVFNIINGFFRYFYIINFYNLSTFVQKRNTIKIEYPSGFNDLLISISTDPRWLSNLYYFSVAATSTYLTSRILFGKNKAKIALQCYAILVGISLLLVLTTLITGNYSIGIGIAQELKNMSQSPIISFVILGLLYLSTIDFKSASE